MASSLLLLVALLAGFGGLLFEIVCFRRTALLLGWGTVGQGIVLGAFLLGLGLGAHVLPARLGRRPLRAAALLYAIVALLLVGGYQALAGVRPGHGLMVWSMAFAVPFLAAFGMGGAFPLLFPTFTASFRGRGAGLLQGANLLGSVVGAGVGGVVLLPRLGFAACVLGAALSYLVAALLAASARCWGRDGTEATSGGALLPRAASRPGLLLVSSGFATLGLEIWLPRRLVFFLGGFLPTFAGTLVAVLLGLGLGSFVAEAIAARRRAPLHAVAFAASIGFGLTLLAVELVGPAIAVHPLESTAESLLVSSVVPCLLALPVTVPLGAILPLVLDELGRGGAVSARAAGRGFLLFSLGALAAALVLPAVFRLSAPRWIVPSLAALAPVAAAGGVRWLLLAAMALALCIAPFASRPALDGARHWPRGQVRKAVLAERSDHVTTASVVQDRVADEKLLYTDEFSAAGGLSSTYMRALGLVPARAAPPAGKIVCLCLGTGTTAAALARGLGERAIDVVELSPAVVALAPWFSGEYEDWSKQSAVHVTDGRHYLESLPARSVAVLTLEPLLPQAPGSVHLYSREFYAAVRRVLRPDGVCAQWLPTHALGPDAYRSLVRTFCEGFPKAQALLIDHSTILLAGGTELDRERSTGESGAADRERALRDAYLCGLWARTDFHIAELDSAAARAAVGGAPIVVDDRPFLETARHASAREVLAWLPENLALWAREPRPSEPATAAAGRLRLRARIHLARRWTDPLGIERALDDLERARRLVPSSTLLYRELRAARAIAARAQAAASLQVGAWFSALQSLQQSIAAAAAQPWELAARAVALWNLERREEARAALRDLRRMLPEFLELAQIRRRRAFLEPLFQRSELTAPPLGDRFGMPDPPASFARAWARGEAWARHEVLRHPDRARWRLAHALVRGLEVGDGLLARLFAQLDLPALEILEGWVRPAGKLVAARLELLAAAVSEEVPLPDWWRKVAAEIDAAEERARGAGAAAGWRAIHAVLGIEPVPDLPPRADVRVATIRALRRQFVPAQKF